MFERVETPRLILRKPVMADAEAIFARYASDPDVTRFMAWPRHTSVEDTRFFLETSDAEWARWPAGPYLVESREDGRLLGASGIHFESSDHAVTGYVFARDAWGKGYATETLRAVVDVARCIGVVRLSALCHSQNAASQRVLGKCGFVCEGESTRGCEFPNLGAGEMCDVLEYVRVLR